MLLVAAGIAAIFIMTRILVRRRRAIQNGIHTEATVVRNVVNTDYHGGRVYTSYSPVLRYYVNGQAHEVIYGGSSMFPKYKEGQAIKIVYRCDNVRDVKIPSDRIQDIAAVVGIAIGLAMFAVGVVGLYINLV